jgi:predicted nucleotidyltransferase
MIWQDAIQKINSLLLEIAITNKGKMEIHITPREGDYISVCYLAGETVELLVEKKSLNVDF